MRCARQPPDSSFVGDRRPQAIIFFSVAVTRPPLYFGRDTSPLYAPSPSKPLKRIPGRRTVTPSGRDVRSGAPEKTRSKDETCDQQGVILIGKGLSVRISMQAAHIGVPPLSPLPPFPRRLGDALQRGWIEKILRSPGASRAQMIPLLDGSDGFSSGGIHGEAWHQNVGKSSLCRRYLTEAPLPLLRAFRTLRRGIGALLPERESALLRLYHHPIFHREQKGLLLPDRILLTGQAPIA